MEYDECSTKSKDKDLIIPLEISSGDGVFCALCL